MRISERDGLRLRIARHQRLRHREPARDRACTRQKLAAVDVAVAVLVLETEDALVDPGLGEGVGWIGGAGGGFGENVIGHGVDSEMLPPSLAGEAADAIVGTTAL